MPVCVCLCACVHVLLYVCMYVCLYVCLTMPEYVFVCTSVCVCMYALYHLIFPTLLFLQWDKAIAVAPSVSMDYWKSLSQRFLSPLIYINCIHHKAKTSIRLLSGSK